MISHTPVPESDSQPHSPTLAVPCPRTPSFDSISNATPLLSSPDTPVHLRTPGTTKLISAGTPSKPPKEDKGMIDEEDEHDMLGDLPDEMNVGLGYGDVEKHDRGEEAVVVVEEIRMEPPGEEPPQRNQGGDGEMEHGEDVEQEGTIEFIDAQVAHLHLAGQQGELVQAVRKLYSPVMDRLPLLTGQIQAQAETIKTLQQQAMMSESLRKIERDRHAAERNGWQVQIGALGRAREREIAAGIRPSKPLELNVGYHQDLEAANKRLEMDNRLMAPRLADTQRQIDKLVTELRYLRSHVILSAEPLAATNPLQPPRFDTPFASTSRPQVPPSQKGKHPRPDTMGDARTEHLLLAAKKVRTMRQTDDRVGRLTLAELQRGGVVGPDGGVGYTEGYGGIISEGEEEIGSSSEDEQMELAPRSAARGKGKASGTPLLPRAKRGSRPTLPAVPTTPRGTKSNRPQTTPGSSNFNDLLRAAELATRPTTPTPGSQSTVIPLAVSATRSTTRPREELTERGSPVKRPRRDDWSSNVRGSLAGPSGTIEEDPASALDLLAQASQDVAQSQSASQSSSTQLASAARFGGLLQDSSHSARNPSSDAALGPAIDLIRSDTKPQPNAQPAEPAAPRSSQPVTTPKARPRSVSNNLNDVHTPARQYQPPSFPQSDNTFDHSTRYASPPSSVSRLDPLAEPPVGAYASPTGAAVPGLGKYVHLTSSMPARRTRSPYVKWTAEEDELLARAVAELGEKWDAVSAQVPTRSYHQVRQRWLRKTGAFDKKPRVQPEATLPPDLEDEDGSPTPLRPVAKKRKASA